MFSSIKTAKIEMYIYMCVFTISLYKGVKRVIAVIIPKFSKGLK